MDLISLVLLSFTLLLALRAIDQRQRIQWLGSYLSRYRIEALMQRLNAAYLRALDTPDEAQRAPQWQAQHDTERQLADQLERLAAEQAQAPAPPPQISRVPLPWAPRWLPGSGLDLARVMQIHARGVRALANASADPEPAARARTLLAELYLFQHSCHWFCRSRGVAGARLVVAHRTPFERVLQLVSPATRQDYGRWIGGRTSG